MPKPGPVADSPRTTLLSVLGEYKEFITILVFFLGGVLWIFGYFATKNQLEEVHSGIKNQVQELRCLLNANRDFLQGRMDSANLSQMLVENIQETNPLSQKPSLTPDEQSRLSRLKVAADDITRKLAAADNTTTQAADRLRSGGCGGS
jgi:hypothetical protein